MEEVKTFNANHPFIFIKYHKASEEILLKQKRTLIVILKNIFNN